MKITMTAIIKRQRLRLYTQKAKKLLKVFIYKKPDTFQKAKQFPLRFYIQKARNFEKKDSLRYVFIYKNPALLHYAVV